MLTKCRHAAGFASAGGLALGVMLVMLAGCQAGELQTVVVTEIVEGEAVERVITATPAAIAEARPAPSTDANEAFDEPPLIQERMIIKNGEISLLVEDTDRAIDQVTQIAMDNGGYVLSSESWYSGDHKTAAITIAVRAEQFEVSMRRLREAALTVLRETASGQDVSEEYVDLDSRLRNLEATRARIQSFLEQADNVNEALEVNRQLADIEAEIEQIKGRMSFLAGRASFSTISVSLETQRPTPTPTPPPEGWSASAVLHSAVETQTSIMRALVAAIIWIAVVLGPYLLIAAVLGIGVRAVYRSGNGRGKSRRNPPSQPPSGQGGSGGAQP